MQRLKSLPTTALTICCLLVTLHSSGCSSQPQRVDVLQISNTDALTDDRLDAARVIWDRVDQGELKQARAQELLKEVAWAPGASPSLRLSVVRKLTDPRADLEDTERVFGLMLPTRIRPPYASLSEVRVMVETAAAKDWKGLTVPIVRAWSYPLGDDLERPERLALEQLHPTVPVEAVVWRVFTGEADESLRDRDRRDAWGLLMRIDPTGSRVSQLLDDIDTSRGSDDPMVTTLVTAREVFGAIPLTSEQFEWAERIAARDQRDFRKRAASAIGSLSPLQEDGLAMRHAAGILWAQENMPELMTYSRDDVLLAAGAAIQPRRQVWRDDPAKGGASNESIERNGDALGWADALLVMIASRIPDEPGLAGVLFELADADKIEETTEFGGVIDARADGSLELLSFPPRIRDRVNDERFVASLDMLRRGDTALFHFHLQAQRHRNSDFAGPSLADVQYATRQGRACVVFTFVSENELNADVYFPDGTTIDLGTIRRPGSASR